MFTHMKYRILGSTNDVTTCECCGRTDLKKTIVLDDYEGNVIYLGETCTAKFMEMKVTEFKKMYNSEVDQLRREKEKFINTHPITKEMDSEINEVNSKGISFKDRKELGYLKKWADMKRQVLNELPAKYSLIS